MEEKKIKKQLKAYLENRLEFEEFDSFIEQINQIHHLTLSKWIEDYFSITDTIEDPDLILREVSLKAVHSKIVDKIATDLTVDKPPLLKRKKLKWTSYAAAFFILFGFILYKYDESKNNVSILSLENNNDYNISAILPDSSEVILYPYSKISYKSTYKSSNREISHISGNVLYKVKKSKIPFLVKHNNYTTRALGTLFFVDTRIKELTKVKLLEGKILVKNTAEGGQEILLNNKGEIQINLHQNRMHLINLMNLPLVNSKIESNKSNTTKGNILWTNNTLTFNHINSYEIFNIIQDLHHVTIITDNNDMLKNKFTGSINRNDNLEDFLINYCELNECSFTIQNNIVTLKYLERKEDVN